MNPKTLTALIDADIEIYRAAAVAQHTVDFDDGDGPTVLLNMERAQEEFRANIRQLLQSCRAKQALLCFTDRSKPKAPFRYRLTTTYKAQRSGIKPELHDPLIDWVKQNFKWRIMPGLEGDDVMAILAGSEGRNRLIIVSIDKDMITVPCRLYVPGKGWERPRVISPETADYNWMFQTLTGDSVDNYGGARGIGACQGREGPGGGPTTSRSFGSVFWTPWRRQDTTRSTRYFRRASRASCDTRTTTRRRDASAFGIRNNRSGQMQKGDIERLQELFCSGELRVFGLDVNDIRFMRETFFNAGVDFPVKLDEAQVELKVILWPKPVCPTCGKERG